MHPRVPERLVNDAPSAFGFQVRSRPLLRFLRAGGGVEALEIAPAPEPRKRPDVAPLAEWTLAGPDREVRGTLYRVDQTFEFWVTDAGAYRVDPEAGRIEIPCCDDEIVREQRLWGVPTTLCYMHRGDLSLHAAAVEVAGGAVVLAAPGRHGKTTLALAFHRHGCRVLSEDLTCCRVRMSPEVLPGPALLRLRTDVYDGQPPPGTHLAMTRPDRVYLGLDDERKGSSAPVPIKAIVFLRDSASDVKLERAPAHVALADLWALNFRLQTDDGRARSFRQLTRLTSAVPAWNLHRPLRLAMLERTVARLLEQFDRDRG